MPCSSFDLPLDSLKKFTIIVAGGSGSRMRSDVPKQFLLISGLPILAYSLRAFHNYDGDMEVILALKKELHADWKSLCIKYDIHLPHRLAEGGETRSETVRNGLSMIGEEGLVAIHDAARPFVSKETIALAFETAASLGNAVPCIPLTDSIRSIKGNSNYIVPREELRIIQTPQVFQVSILKQSYDRFPGQQFSDDASVVESAGGKIVLIPGNPDNIKITYQHDILVAESLLRKRE